MKTYICKNCGFIINLDSISDSKCPKCGSSENNLELIENKLEEGEIDAIIESVIDETKDSQYNKIINQIEDEKYINISDNNNTINKIKDKCINCGQCKKTCEKIANVSYNMNKCKEPICIGCGQCILNCPTSALIPKYEYRKVKDIIDENKKIVIAIVSPAVIASVDEISNLDSESDYEKKLVGALKKIGFDYVFDGGFGSDLTIMEQSVELLNKIKEGKTPMFSSSCPAWIKYCEIYHSELLKNLSLCKSPVSMQCEIIKNYFCNQKGFDKEKIVTVSITSCTARKMEGKDYSSSIDYVITTSELDLLLKEEEIKLKDASESDYDGIINESSGSGKMADVSGGLSEGIARTIYKILTRKSIQKSSLEFNSLRGFNGIKTAIIKIGNLNLKIAVVQKLENLEKLLKNDEYKKYHYIEVMSCDGGCIGGGGQPIIPISKIDDIKNKRYNIITNKDKKSIKRCAYENEEIKSLYKNYLKKPYSDKSIELLYTTYSSKKELLNNKKD